MINTTLLSIEINIDPVIVDVIGLEITWHGLFTALGVVIGVAVAAAFARRAGYLDDTIYNVALCLVIGGIIGARGLYVIEKFGSEFDNDLTKIFSINSGGISIYGALIGGTIGGWLYAVIAKVPDIPRGLDIGAMGGILGMAVGRIGDIINGEHFASDTTMPWGLVYTHPDSPSYITLGPNAEPQHPAVAYEMIGDLLIFAILVLLFVRVNRMGITFFAWVFLYGLLRTLVSFLRVDDIVLLGLRTAQLIGIGAMVVGLVGMFYLIRKPEVGISRSERRRIVREEVPGAVPEEEPSG